MAAKARPALELADIFRKHGSGWRTANRGHVSLGQPTPFLSTPEAGYHAAPSLR